MWKDLLFKLISMPLLRDGINFVLRYITAQPVDMDVMVSLYLAADFAGLSFLFKRFALEEQNTESDDSENLIQTEFAS